MSSWLNDAVHVGRHGAGDDPAFFSSAPHRPAAAARHHVAVARLPGITPVMSLLTTALAQEPGSRCHPGWSSEPADQPR